MRKYEFNWNLIGDIKVGRPNLGDKVDLEMYRLLLYTIRDVLDDRFGNEETDKLLFDAGELAGNQFYHSYIDPVGDLNEFVSKTQKVLREKNIGIMRIEEVKLDEGKVVLTVDEDVDCSGLPEIDYEVCVYDEGFISGLFKCYTGAPWVAKEIDCWCTGARTCRFSVTQQQ